MQNRFTKLGMVLFFCLFLWACPVWSAEESAIMAAVLENDPAALQEALKSGVWLDETDNRGYSPLWRVCL